MNGLPSFLDLLVADSHRKGEEILYWAFAENSLTYGRWVCLSFTLIHPQLPLCRIGGIWYMYVYVFAFVCVRECESVCACVHFLMKRAVSSALHFCLPLASWSLSLLVAGDCGG